MNAFPVLNDEQWSKLLEQIAETYNEVTLSRGFNYFKQQQVTSLVISDNRDVHARVSGSEDYKVILDLDKLRSSRCTCPVHTNCKHMAAAMMELADRLGYPASQIVNAKHQIKRSASISLTTEMLKQLPQMDAIGWHKVLTDWVSSIKPSHDQGYYANTLRQVMQNIPKNDIFFSDTDRIFFELHQELFILQKMKEQSAQSSVTYYTHFSFYRIYDDIQGWLKEKSFLFDPTISKERLEQTLTFLRQQLAGESGDKYMDYGLYAALWKYWISPHPGADGWVLQEIEAMEKLSVDSASASLSAAKALLYLKQARSSEAWETLHANGLLKQAPTHLFLSFLDDLCHAQNWVDLIAWLSKSTSYFHGPKTRELEAYASYWKEAILHAPDVEPQMWSVLEELLPHSYRLIEDMLYEQGKWRPWLEMQILQGQDPLYHRVSVLQPIEKETPKLLLPYYHQSVERYVGLKNRHDYKSAVKLLKRLQKIYKKIKQTERWDNFFSSFVNRHSRLRALQEELKKGKLLE